MHDVPLSQEPNIVRSELERILASSAFDASNRNRAFLRYVVEETLDGRSDRIKAYNIATSVFGRDESFDPQIDAIVRIEAGRLRRSLERYYLSGGRGDGLRIDIPKGSYIPVFVPNLTQHGGEVLRPPGAQPAIVVVPFEEEGDHSVYPHFARGLTRALVVGLTRFSNLFVFGVETSFHQSGVERERLRAELGADYILSGGTSLDVDRFAVDALLTDARTGRTVWAESYERTLVPAEIVALRNEVANRVARTLAQPYGVIQAEKSRDSEGLPPASLGSYDSVLQFYRYWRDFDRDRLEQVRQSLERAVTAEPGYAEALACLSLTYSNAYRFGHPLGNGGAPSLQRALALARQAVEQAPNSSWALYAMSFAYWFANDVRESLKALEAARQLNANDTAIMADLGQRYAMIAAWDKGVPLLEEAYARNPALPGHHRIGLFLFHFAHGRFEEALLEARKIVAPQVLYGHLAVATAAVRLGHREEAQAAVSFIRDIDPGYGDRVAADLAGRNVEPGLVSMLVDALGAAGLPGLDTTCAAAGAAC